MAGNTGRGANLQTRLNTAIKRRFRTLFPQPIANKGAAADEPKRSKYELGIKHPTAMQLEIIDRYDKETFYIANGSINLQGEVRRWCIERYYNALQQMYIKAQKSSEETDGETVKIPKRKRRK